MKNIKSGANFSIVMPGKCPAKCKFCFGTNKESGPDFIPNLVKYLKELPITTISITGGEPTTSPLFEAVLGILKGVCPDKKVVLNTNAYNLDCNITNFDVINHINISRHLTDDEANDKIFGTLMPSELILRETCEEANRLGIDVTLNTVVSSTFSHDPVEMYIDFAKEIGASAVCFRRDCADKTLELPDIAPLYKPVSHEECPVCSTTGYYINGMSVYFKQGLMETMHNDEIFEMILHPDGRLCEDWAGKELILVDFEIYGAPCSFSIHEEHRGC